MDQAAEALSIPSYSLQQPGFSLFLRAHMAKINRCWHVAWQTIITSPKAHLIFMYYAAIPWPFAL